MAKGCTRRHRDCGMWPCPCREMCCLMECSPRALGFPFLFLWATEALPSPKKRSLQAKSLHVLRMWRCLKLQAVLHNQLTATKAPEKLSTASRICTSVHWVGKWRKSMPEKVNGKETAQPQWDSARVSRHLYGLQECYTSSKPCCSGGGEGRKWNTRFYLTCSYRVYWYATQNIMEGNYLCQH